MVQLNAVSLKEKEIDKIESSVSAVQPACSTATNIAVGQLPVTGQYVLCTIDAYNMCWLW